METLSLVRGTQKVALEAKLKRIWRRKLGAGLSGGSRALDPGAGSLLWKAWWGGRAMKSKCGKKIFCLLPTQTLEPHASAKTLLRAGALGMPRATQVPRS